jgi:uncharacterized OsmC-like protein
MSEQTATKQNTLNGVNVDQLFETIGMIKEDSEIAKFKFRNKNNWIDGGLNRSVISDFYGAKQEFTGRKFELYNDEPPVLLSNDKAPNPVEYILHGMAGCITTTLVCHAAARGIEIEEVETSFEGDIDLRGLLAMDENVKPGYKEIRVNINVKADCPDNELKELVEFAKNHSPVFDTIQNPVPVKLNINV